MPTKADFEELINNCIWEWKTLNGVKGYKVSSTVTGNSNYIFLPAGGTDKGFSIGKGYYWSSSLFEQNERAWHIFFASGYKYMDEGYRYVGRSIRPVCSSR